MHMSVSSVCVSAVCFFRVAFLAKLLVLVIPASCPDVLISHVDLVSDLVRIEVVVPVVVEQNPLADQHLLLLLVLGL